MYEEDVCIRERCLYYKDMFVLERHAFIREMSAEREREGYDVCMREMFDWKEMSVLEICLYLRELLV